MAWIYTMFNVGTHGMDIHMFNGGTHGMDIHMFSIMHCADIASTPPSDNSEVI